MKMMLSAKLNRFVPKALSLIWRCNKKTNGVILCQTEVSIMSSHCGKS